MKLTTAIENVTEFNKLSEPELWNEIQCSNHNAFSYLYRRYIQELFRYGIYLDRDKNIVEDVIHDVFVSIWINREKNTQIKSLKAYLYSSVRRGILKKKAKYARETHEESLWSKTSSKLVERSFEENLIFTENENETLQQLREVINSLSNKQREIIFLRFYQNLSYSEISGMLNIEQNYAYNLASKAFASIKSKMITVSLLLCLTLLI